MCFAMTGRPRDDRYQRIIQLLRASDESPLVDTVFLADDAMSRCLLSRSAQLHSADVHIHPSLFEEEVTVVRGNGRVRVASERFNRVLTGRAGFVYVMQKTGAEDGAMEALLRSCS